MNIVSKVLVGAVCIAGVIAAVTSTAGATTNSTCVDGNKRYNLSITWNSSKNVTVGTVGNKALCKDVTLFFSSYTMPDNYNGLPFVANPTASPQAIFDSASIVLKKGVNQPQTMAIDLPEACKNVQVDVYYAPEIKVVTSKGHGAQYISGKILKKTANECTPPTTPEEPEQPTPEVPVPEAQTPPTPAPQVQVTPVVPVTELPKTGSSLTNLLAIGGVLSAVTYAAVYAVAKRQ